MKAFSAYCRYCSMVVSGKVNAITELESGNYLYVGECLICLYEIRRIVPKNKFINSAYEQPKLGDPFGNNINLNGYDDERSWNGL